MMIIEQRSPELGGRGRLVALSGSCRILDGSGFIGERGFQRVLGRGNPLAHTLAQTIQNWRQFMGEVTVDPDLDVFVLTREGAAFEREFARVLPHVDVLFAEVCDARQMIAEGICLNQGAVTRDLVQVHARHLTAWFGELSRSGTPRPETIEAAIAAMREAGALTPIAERLIRGTRMIVYGPDDVAAQLRELKALAGCRVVLVTHSAPPDEAGAAFRTRRDLARDLQAVAAVEGVQCFDPSLFFAHRPRAEVFDAEGRDMHHFSPAQHLLMGHALAAMAADPDLSPEQAVLRALETPEAPAFRAPMAAVDAQLLETFAARLGELGGKASGLKGYYEERIARGSVFGPSRKGAFDWTLAFLPKGARLALVGASAGELPLALAAAGYRVDAWLGSRNRVATAEAGHQALLATGIVQPGAVRFHEGRLPRRGRFDLVIATDASIGGADGEPDAMLAAIGRGAQALIEVRHFGRTRFTFADQARFLDELAAAGWMEDARPAGEGLVALRRPARGWLARLGEFAKSLVRLARRR